MANTISKEAKKIYKKMLDAQAQAETLRRGYQSKMDDAKAKLQEASDKLELAEDPATYTELLEQIRINKGAISFYKSKLEKSANTPLFTDNEYKDMRARMLIEYNAQISHDAIQLADKVHELWSMLAEAESLYNEYIGIIEQLSGNSNAIDYTTANASSRINMDMQSGIDPATDRGIYRQFIRLYFECRVKLNTLSRHNNNLILP